VIGAGGIVKGVGRFSRPRRGQLPFPTAINRGITGPDPAQPLPFLTEDAPRNFFAARKAEAQYARNLRSVAREIGRLVSRFFSLPPHEGGEFHSEHSAEIVSVGRRVLTRANVKELEDALARYAKILDPWARSVAGSMIADVARRDLMEWRRRSRTMSRELAREIEHTPIGERVRELMDEQVTLITSLPLVAAQRVHEQVMGAQLTSARPAEVATAIMRTGHVTESRAKLIARTEVARASSVLVQARAEFVGSTGYIWRTVGDSDVRLLHRKLEGQFIPWDKPPIAAEPNIRAHAGQIFNCRCRPEPVIPDVF